MNSYTVQITCTRTIEVEAEDRDAAERLAYERFDSAAYGNMETDFILETGNESQDK